MSGNKPPPIPQERKLPSPPPSISTQITIGPASTPEEEALYAAAGSNAAAAAALARAASPGFFAQLPSFPARGVDNISPSSSNSSCDGDEKEEDAAATPVGGLENMDKYPPSMTESVRAHVYESGIRYHAYKSGKYAFPNDEIEQNRDDMKHSMTLLLMQGAFFYAPVGEVLERSGAEVLDLGTGTGIWAIELADKYPNAMITGIDLSPIQPNYVPENVHFFIDDFDEEWVDPPNKYDFIHIRHTMHSVRDPKALLDRVMHHLKPGGYLEVQEIFIRPTSDDDSVSPTIPYALRDFLNYMEAGLRVLGSEMHAIRRLPQELEEAGFVDIKKTVHKAPIGMWPKDKRLRLCGLFLRTAMLDGLRGLSHRPLTALGWTRLQIEMVLVDVRKALMDPNVHAYFGFHDIYARKPFDHEIPRYILNHEQKEGLAGGGTPNDGGRQDSKSEREVTSPISPRKTRPRTESKGENGVP